jgi:hypothetical protein
MSDSPSWSGVYYHSDCRFQTITDFPGVTSAADSTRTAAATAHEHAGPIKMHRRFYSLTVLISCMLVATRLCGIPYEFKYYNGALLLIKISHECSLLDCVHQKTLATRTVKSACNRKSPSYYTCFISATTINPQMISSKENTAICLYLPLEKWGNIYSSS